MTTVAKLAEAEKHIRIATSLDASTRRASFRVAPDIKSTMCERD